MMRKMSKQAKSFFGVNDLLELTLLLWCLCLQVFGHNGVI